MPGSDFSSSWMGMRQTPEIGITAEGGGKKHTSMSDVHFYLLKQLHHLNSWLKSRNPKKVTNWAQDIVEESKIANKAKGTLQEKLKKHSSQKAQMLREMVDRKLSHKHVLEDFTKIVQEAFPKNTSVRKHINQTLRLHEQHMSDLQNAKALVKGI